MKLTDAERPQGFLYPLFLILKGKRALLVGGGAVALRKARVLWESGCDLTVVSKRYTDPFRTWLKARAVTWEERPYADGEASAYFLVVSATDDPLVNHRVYEDACRSERLVNVVDQPHLCNFFVPSVVRRGALQVAVSTSGDCPALSRRIRRELEGFLPERYGPLLQKLADIRNELKRRLPTPELRKAALEEILATDAITRFLEGEDAPLEEVLRTLPPVPPKPSDP
jgi:siroheme synthase-like protein